MNFSKGDLIDPSDWREWFQIPQETWLHIKAVCHNIDPNPVDSSCINHLIKLCVATVPRPE